MGEQSSMITRASTRATPNGRVLAQRELALPSSRVAPNEVPVALGWEDLSSHVRVVRPSRSSLTYDRME
jgi:hypothetical protein